MKFICLSLCLLAAPAFADDCIISSPHYPELAIGANKITLCASVEKALAEKGYTSVQNLELTVTDWPNYGPAMDYRFVDGSSVVTGSGLEYWDPDEANFVIYHSISILQPI